MKPAVSQVCSLESPFEKDIEDYAAGALPGDRAVGRQARHVLERHSEADLLRLLERARRGRAGGQLSGRTCSPARASFAAALGRLRPAAGAVPALGIGTLVLAGDIAGPLEQQDLDRVQLSLAQAADSAGEHGVRLALEFQARAAFVNNLQTAAALVAEIGSPHLGICLDVFHYYSGPSKPEDLGYLSAENLFHVQLCDLAGRAARVGHRRRPGLPGDGDFQLACLIVDRLREIGYAAASRSS